MDLFWIDESLAVAARPRGGDWLDDEMASLVGQNVTMVVSCLTPAEEQELELEAEHKLATRHGLGFVRAPMPDRGTPPSRSQLEAVIAQIASRRSAGERVVIHCRQGLGRAPLVAAASLVRSGKTPDEAWDLISERRGRPVPDTDVQRAWLESFAELR